MRFSLLGLASFLAGNLAFGCSESSPNLGAGQQRQDVHEPGDGDSDEDEDEDKQADEDQATDGRGDGDGDGDSEQDEQESKADAGTAPDAEVPFVYDGRDRSCSMPCPSGREGGCRCDFNSACGYEFDEAKNGKKCKVKFQSCVWPDALSGPGCDCNENEDGELHWSCAHRLG